MNDNDYKEALFHAASIFNERLGAEFSEDNLVLRCFQTENQQEVLDVYKRQPGERNSLYFIMHVLSLYRSVYSS